MRKKRPFLLFWLFGFFLLLILSAAFSGKMTADLAQKETEKIVASKESVDNFKKEFTTAATSLFGSGWVWLAKDKKGKLYILSENNAGNPITKGYTPILGIDVWEHAYYLDYQNRRPEHIEKLWTIIDWSTIGARYK